MSTFGQQHAKAEDPACHIFQRCAAVRRSLRMSLPGTAACPLWTGVLDAWPSLKANHGQEARSPNMAGTFREGKRKPGKQERWLQCRPSLWNS